MLHDLNLRNCMGRELGREASNGYVWLIQFKRDFSLGTETPATKPENPGAWPQLVCSVRAGVKVKNAVPTLPILLGHTVRQHSSLIVPHVRQDPNQSTHAERRIRFTQTTVKTLP